MVDVSNNGSKIKPRFDFTFNFGHVIIVLGFAGTIGLAALGLRDEVKEQAYLNRQSITELKSKDDAHEARLSQIERQETLNRTEEQNFRSEVRKFLADMQETVTQIREKIAANAGGGRQR